jgi:hypothetical protein
MACAACSFGVYNDAPSTFRTSTTVEPGIIYLLTTSWSIWCHFGTNVETPASCLFSRAHGASLHPTEASLFFWRPNATDFHPAANQPLQLIHGVNVLSATNGFL